MTVDTSSTTTATDDVRAALREILESHHALTLASTGAEFSPWIFGAYYASDEKLNIYLTLEKSGKTLRNVEQNPAVSLMISDNDAMKDFVQAQGRIVLLSGGEEERVHELLTQKMPWYKLYTPSSYARLEVSRFFVSSFARGWFPAKQLVP